MASSRIVTDWMDDDLVEQVRLGLAALGVTVSLEQRPVEPVPDVEAPPPDIDPTGAGLTPVPDPLPPAVDVPVPDLPADVPTVEGPAA